MNSHGLKKVQPILKKVKVPIIERRRFELYISKDHYGWILVGYIILLLAFLKNFFYHRKI